jgi:hypothetical protein
MRRFTRHLKILPGAIDIKKNESKMNIENWKKVP